MTSMAETFINLIFLGHYDEFLFLEPFGLEKCEMCETSAI